MRVRRQPNKDDRFIEMGYEINEENEISRANKLQKTGLGARRLELFPAWWLLGYFPSENRNSGYRDRFVPFRTLEGNGFRTNFVQRPKNFVLRP